MNKEITNYLLELSKQPGNNTCADCFGKTPRWAVLPHGIFICHRCSGAHRKLGTQFSFVKSITLDTWKQSESNIMKIGNVAANKYFEYSIPADVKRPDSESDEQNIRETFVKNKYQKKIWANSSVPYPTPDSSPDVLQQPPPQTSPVQSPSPATSTPNPSSSMFSSQFASMFTMQDSSNQGQPQIQAVPQPDPPAAIPPSSNSPLLSMDFLTPSSSTSSTNPSTSYSSSTSGDSNPLLFLNSAPPSSAAYQTASSSPSSSFSYPSQGASSSAQISPSTTSATEVTYKLTPALVQSVVVRFNIGGTLFFTQLSTLSALPPTSVLYHLHAHILSRGALIFFPHHGHYHSFVRVPAARPFLLLSTSSHSLVDEHVYTTDTIPTPLDANGTGLIRDGEGVATPVFFLDRNPSLFRYLFEYIRTVVSGTVNATSSPPVLDAYTATHLKGEFSFFGIPWPTSWDKN